MFVNKKFVNEGFITKITKILCHKNLELYGKYLCEQQKPGLFFDWPGNEATIRNDDFDFKVANPYNPEILAIL